MRYRTQGYRGCGLAATVLALASCGATGDLAQDLGAASGDFIVVDLSTMALQTQVTVSDLRTNPEYRDQYMVFRSVPSGTSLIGSALGSFGHDTDEPRSTVITGRILIGVFEITQAQWGRLSAAPLPWPVLPGSLVGPTDSAKPAVGLTQAEVTTELAALTTGDFLLRLPTPTEWERGCGGGSTTTFSWGEDRDDATVGTYAVVSETAGASVGPRLVGTRTANAYGLFDMHGNVWEWTSNGEIRGGSWRDSLASARSANRVSLDTFTSHPLVGARLVLEFR